MKKNNKIISESHQQNRRLFLKSLSLGSGAIMLVPLMANGSNENQDELYKNFLNPRAEAKPFFRWWWNGNRLSEKEIIRELKLMHDAGIGGIEISPIEMPEWAIDMIDEAVDWLSDDWVNYLQFTIKEAKKLGMVTDLIVGTGWPFGGEFLDNEETIQGVSVEVSKLNGPKIQTILLPQAKGDANFEVKRITLFPIKICSLKDGISIPFNPSKNTITVNIPNGEHELHILTWQNNFRSVKYGAPGGAGPVLDHFNRPAVEKYLNHMSDRIKQKTGKPKLEGIRAMFCDSIELNRANWTSGFGSIFKERRGYDIQPYLSLILRNEIIVNPEFNEELKRARYDYSSTLSELFTESFIVPFHKWCNENGMLSRYQAYGYPSLYTDLIDGSMIVDIPEGDQWLFNGSWQPYADVDEIRYAIWNKYTSSAGHLANKKIISTEAMTNTSGVFKASLKYIKQATDLNIATGINHQVLHGFNYSPPEVNFPGWIRFGCYFNENNPWWQYMHKWSQYSSRLSQIFQDSTAISQVAIMGPTLDIWSKYGLDRNPFNLEPWYLHALWQALNHLGFCSDYVNNNMLKNATLENGYIVVGAMKYDILLLCDVETLLPDVAGKIDKLSQQGAQIVIIGNRPSQSPNMKEATINDSAVEQYMESALNSGVLTVPSPEDRLKKSQHLLMDWTNKLMTNCKISPAVKFSKHSAKLFQYQSRKNKTDILFLTNMDRNEHYISDLFFGEKTKLAVQWDPETGKKIKLKFTTDDCITIDLQPLASLLLIFNPYESINEIDFVEVDEPKTAIELNGPWEVIINQIKTSKDIPEGKQKSITLNKLTPINEFPEFRNFGGEVSYKTQFEVYDTKFSKLTIDEVYETAEVFLNGKNLGLSWWGNNDFNIKNNLINGTNVLEIKVSTLLANYCASLKDNKTTQHWVLRYKDKSPVKCGLVGKVKLV